MKKPVGGGCRSDGRKCSANQASAPACWTFFLMMNVGIFAIDSRLKYDYFIPHFLALALGPGVLRHSPESLSARISDSFNRLILAGHGIFDECFDARPHGIRSRIYCLPLNGSCRTGVQKFHAFSNGVVVDVDYFFGQGEEWILGENIDGYCKQLTPV